MTKEQQQARVTEFLSHYVERSNTDPSLCRALTVVVLEANEFDEFSGVSFHGEHVCMNFCLGNYMANLALSYAELTQHSCLQGFMRFKIDEVVRTLRRERRRHLVTGLMAHNAQPKDTRPNPEPSHEG